MKNQPLLVSIVIGIILIFAIVGASLVAKLSNVSKLHKKESIKSMELGEENEQLKANIVKLEEEVKELVENKKTLEGVVSGLQSETTTLKVEIEKLKKIKEAFGQRLEEELTKEEKSMKK